MNKYYKFKIYTLDPISGTTGWEIERVSVKADSREEAEDRLQRYPFFDCIIDFNHSFMSDRNCTFFTTTSYPSYDILKIVNIK